jgi:hypothetical protein
MKLQKMPPFSKKKWCYGLFSLFQRHVAPLLGWSVLGQESGFTTWKSFMGRNFSEVKLAKNKHVDPVSRKPNNLEGSHTREIGQTSATAKV